MREVAYLSLINTASPTNTIHVLVSSRNHSPKPITCNLSTSMQDVKWNRMQGRNNNVDNESIWGNMTEISHMFHHPNPHTHAQKYRRGRRVPGDLWSQLRYVCKNKTSLPYLYVCQQVKEFWPRGCSLVCSKQGCGAVTFFVGSGYASGSGSGQVFRLRLRLRVNLFDGSGSGSGSDAQVLIWALTSNTIFKTVKYQNMTSY